MQIHLVIIYKCYTPLQETEKQFLVGEHFCGEGNIVGLIGHRITYFPIDTIGNRDYNIGKFRGRLYT